ncbi:hypothetical protein BDV96DRAFT_503523, partial [Lophiotrema nucula]
GLYCGQAAHFRRSHPGELPSAIDRHVNEIKGMTSVLETLLIAHDNKYMFADIYLLPYHFLVEGRQSS